MAREVGRVFETIGLRVTECVSEGGWMKVGGGRWVDEGGWMEVGGWR